MPVIANLREQLSELRTLKFISSAFTEASAVKIKNMRATFEQNRLFYDDLGQIFQAVKESAIRQKLQVDRAKTPQDQKILSIAVTSNLRFFGLLNIDTIKKFIEQTQSKKTDRIVIGTTGAEYLRELNYPHEFKTISFTKDFPSPQEITSFLQTIKPYDKVFMYFPRFANLLSQPVAVTDITQSPHETQTAAESISYIFEPELAKILDFFENQVRSLLLVRVMLEAEISRTAARLLSMSTAQEQAETIEKERLIELDKATKSYINAQLLESFSAKKKKKSDYD